jgi:hypothetical protein
MNAAARAHWRVATRSLSHDRRSLSLAGGVIAGGRSYLIPLPPGEALPRSRRRVSFRAGSFSMIDLGLGVLKNRPLENTRDIAPNKARHQWSERERDIGGTAGGEGAIRLEAANSRPACVPNLRPAISTYSILSMRKEDRADRAVPALFPVPQRHFQATHNRGLCDLIGMNRSTRRSGFFAQGQY